MNRFLGLRLLLFLVFPAAAFLVPKFIENRFISKPLSDEFPGYTYESDWNTVDSLSNLGLFQQASEKTQRIYSKAKSDRNTPQIVKCFFYRSRFSQVLQEDSEMLFLQRIHDEIGQAPVYLKALLYSVKASFLWSYYQNNRYVINERTPVLNPDEEDIQVWDANLFLDNIRSCYLLSLQDADKLKQVPIDKIESILDGNPEFRSLRPTLYDFLVHRALAFFSDEEANINRPVYAFDWNNPDFFLPAPRFVTLNPATRDTVSSEWFTFRLYQDILRFHLESGNKAALVDADLKRLQHVRSNFKGLDGDKYHLDALIEMEGRFRRFDAVAAVKYEIASFYRNSGNKYQVSGSDTSGKSHLQKAVDICYEISSRFKGSIYDSNALKMVGEITRPLIDVTMEYAVISERPNLALLTFKNSPKAFFRIVKADHTTFIRKNQTTDRNSISDYLSSLEPVNSWNINLPDDKLHHTHSAEIEIPALSNGFYVLLASYTGVFDAKSEYSYIPFFATRLSVSTNMVYGKGLCEFLVTDRISGKPVSDAKIILTRSEYDYKTRAYRDIVVSNLISDKKGLCSYQAVGENYYSYGYSVKFKDDFLVAENKLGLYKDRYKEKPFIRTSFFTDRAIYRPGQTIYFKGIKIRKDGDKNELVTGTATDVIFRDANYQEIKRIKLQVSDFGTFNGTFEIPVDLATGSFSISDAHGSHSIFVEEYKRPKFEVSIDKPEKAYTVFDTIQISGSAKALAGFNITDARVQYRVYRTVQYPIWWRMWFDTPASSEQELTFGTTISDENGKFGFSFPALPDPAASSETDPVFTYRIVAEVTDQSGETRSAELNVNAGFKSVQITHDIPSVMNKNSTVEYIIRVENLNGVLQKQTVQVKLEKLKLPEKPIRNRLWKMPDVFLFEEAEFKKKFPYDPYKNEHQLLVRPAEKQILNYIWESSDSLKFDFKSLRTEKPGIYRVVLTTRDASGKDVKAVHFFNLSDESDNRSTYGDFMSVQPLTGVVEPGDEAKFSLSSSSTVFVLYQLQRGDELLRRDWLSINNEQKIIRIPITEKDRGNLQVNFVCVSQGRWYSYSAAVIVPRTDKELSVKWETYRDKLLPGSKEQWKLTVKPKTGSFEPSELLLSMYDASLDAFVVNNWFLQLWNSRYASSYWSSSLHSIKNGTRLHIPEILPLYYRFPEFENMNFFGYYPYYYFGGDLFRSAFFEDVTTVQVMGVQKAPGKKTESDDDRGRAEANEGKVGGFAEQSGGELMTGDTRNTDKLSEGGKTLPRTNFNETAFFFPDLKADEEGNIVFTFTMPESLTRWKILGLAHTRSLRTSSFQKEVITQKDVMINTFAPRFLREGDMLYFSAKATNLTDQELSAQMKLELFDAQNERPINAEFQLIDPVKKISIRPGLSVGINWRIRIPYGISLVKYRVTVVSGDYSDGEENTLPVLTNRQLVTETVPLWLNDWETKTFSIPKLSQSSSTRSHVAYTVEFTSNPAWYAIQSLPYLMEFPYDCAEQVFSRFYANSIGFHLANSQPKIKETFDNWAKSEPDALLSNLEKNEELKNIVLEETPWVREAKNESEKKRRVGVLFDVARMKKENDKAVRKLEDLQVSNGGFPWFKGGPDDRYITQHIVSGVGKLIRLGVKEESPRITRMMTKALPYLDQRIKEDYQELQKRKIDLAGDNLGYIQIHYFYARSFFMEVPISPDCKQAVDYYQGQAIKYRFKKDDYAQGMLALGLSRMGFEKEAKELISGLKDRSIYNEEMGMYWKGMMQGGYYWYNAPIETMALLIEAFQEVKDDEVSVNKMRRWLLKNKQTRDWKTTRATADACYALLLRGTDYLATDAGLSLVFGDGQSVKQPEERESGTGYFSVRYTPEEIKPYMAKISVSKNSAGPAWGAVYWQYLEDLDKISKPTQANPLVVTKKLFKEVKTDKGLRLEEISPQSKLEVGDRIISRIVFSSDRPMEYVHLKDMRGSGLEPENVLSGYRWKSGLGYYESTRDVATHFFISYVPRGTYVFEYPSRITHQGSFSNGITQVQCMYAPEFTFHTEGIRFTVGP